MLLASSGATRGIPAQLAVALADVKPDTVIHLAAAPLATASNAFSEEATQINLNGTMCLLEAGIFVMSARGSDTRNLTASPGDDVHPAWSPDGQAIAFASDREDDFELYAMSADGTGQRRLTDSPGRDGHPSWSPDGRRLAFVSTGYRPAKGDIGLEDRPQPGLAPAGLQVMIVISVLKRLARGTSKGTATAPSSPDRPRSPLRGWTRSVGLPPRRRPTGRRGARSLRSPVASARCGER